MASFPDRLLDAVPGARERLHRMWADGARAEDWLAWQGDAASETATPATDETTTTTKAGA